MDPLAELERLARSVAGVRCARTATTLELRAGPLPIAAALADGRLHVTLAGWSHAFTLDPDDPDDAAAELESALDLVGAALFGAVRVRVRTAGDRDHAWTLEVLRDAWFESTTTGGRAWNPFARRSERLLANACARPPDRAPRLAPLLPSAPWLGLAGFTAPTAPPPADVPIDGVLDLHLHAPKTVRDVVLAYLDACRERRITHVRIIHGKGVGNLRRTVHALLDRHPHVLAYRLGGAGEGSWGATLVDLRPPGDGPVDPTR